MNRELTNNRVIPRRAIVVYSDNPGRNYYLESRDIVSRKGGYEFGAAVPMATSALQDVAKSFIKKNSVSMEVSGFIPDHLLYGINRVGLTAVAWYRPAMVRSLNFSKQLKIKGKSTAKIPATLYLVLNNNLYLFALMNDGRPCLSTKLYNAPYFNIYDDGRVCLGTANVGKIKAKTFEKEAERFERAFYMAEQNGGNTDGRCKSGLVRCWNTQLKGNKDFPSKKELIPHKKYKSFGELINKLIGDKNYEQEDQEEDDDYLFEGDYDDLGVAVEI